MSHFQQDFIKAVIEIYGLELDDREIDDVLSAWMRQYDSTWIIKAIVESLYRGRYKIVCVESILSNWQRLGNPRYQFTPEYEREILAQIPIANHERVNENPIVAPPATDSLAPLPESIDPESTPPAKIDDRAGNRPKRTNCDLNPEESAPFQSPHLPRSICYFTNPVDSSDRSANLALTQPLDVSEQFLVDEYLASMSLQSAQQIQQQDDSDRDRHSSKPVNRKLFNTLKTIVDPNSQYKLEYDTIDRQSLKDRQITNITQFEVSIEHTH
ncbi:hypothetical protein [Chamaesiphon sp. GL140_3_metabinner_50]|uniref:hypothetical protein n=1 Tax=Chamaesiphon sp. GL140_3_metabinner_50 TaxID=2970812 RepID=UPI0025F8D79B|nr:hypothetical protein [Chamaesiphon sp. GL140_3_metabinner_50]